MKEDLRGNCSVCKYYDGFNCYCSYYKIITVTPYVEPTCNNMELVKK